MDRPINVLHLLGTAQPEGSGIATIVSALARGIDLRRFKLHAWFLESDGPLISELSEAGVDACWVDWKNGSFDPMGAFRFWHRIQSERFDIVHQHWGARSIRRLVRSGSAAKIIVHHHGRIKKQRQGEREPVAVRGADAIITVSESIAHQLLAKRVFVVYSAVSPSEHPLRTTPRPENTVVIGTACRLVEAKGVRDLIRAFAALHEEHPTIRLQIAGSGPERGPLLKEAGSRGMEQFVRFLGWRNDLRDLLNTWDIFVLPSYDEGLPIAILEAMAEGLPVISTNVGGIPEVVEHEGTGYLVEPGNSIELCAALRKLIQSPSLRSHLGQAGRTRVEARFSIKKMVADVSEIYERVAERR